MADRVFGRPGGPPAGGLGPALDGAVASAVAPHLAGLGAEEGVAGPALAAHDRFQEEREWRPGDFYERREGCVAVQHHLAQHGDHPALLGAGEEIGAGVAHPERSGVHRAWIVARSPPRHDIGAGCASRSPPPSPSVRSSGLRPRPHRAGTRDPRSSWRAAPSCGGAALSPTPRSTTTKLRLTASSSSSGRSVKGSPIPHVSSRPTNWSWKCTGGPRRAASSASSGGATRP